MLAIVEISQPVAPHDNQSAEAVAFKLLRYDYHINQAILILDRGA